MEQSCRWTRERLLAHQRASVDALRRFAYERSPFYARFHRGLQSAPMEQLPVLTKAVQDQQKEIDELKAEIKTLSERK